MKYVPKERDDWAPLKQAGCILVPFAIGRVPPCDKSLLFEIVETQHLGDQIRELE
jgi:hypothetical protein